MDPEHPDLYHGSVQLRYRLTAERLAELFDVKELWKLTYVDFLHGGLGAEFIFAREVAGPLRAMELLGGKQ